MKKLLLITALIFISSHLRAQTWINVQNTGYNKDDSGNEMCTDNSGNVFITGYFTDSIQFGTTKLYSDSNGSDVFIAKYNSSGTCQWTRTAGSYATDQSFALPSNQTAQHTLQDS